MNARVYFIPNSVAISIMVPMLASTFLSVALFVSCISVCSPSLAAEDAIEQPFTDVAVAEFTRRVSRAMVNADLEEAIALLTQQRDTYVSAQGVDSVESVSANVVLREYVALRRLDANALEEFFVYYRSFKIGTVHGAIIIDTIAPQPEQYEAMGSALSNAYIGFRGLLPGDNLFTAECGCWLGLHRAAKRDFKEASAFLMEAHGILERLFGKASPVPIAVGISCARLLTEMGENYQRQKDLLETSIAFGEKNSTERRYVLWKERSMAYLAEAIYRSGDGAEADRIFGIVETHIANQPGSPDLASVKASCAQNRVRHLIVEKRFEEALVVIDEMADGSWPAPNKGLGAERLFRMRADLLRRVGREKDAQLDERIVRMIGDNVTELQAVSCAPIGRIERSPER